MDTPCMCHPMRKSHLSNPSNFGASMRSSLREIRCPKHCPAQILLQIQSQRSAALASHKRNELHLALTLLDSASRQRRKEKTLAPDCNNIILFLKKNPPAIFRCAFVTCTAPAGAMFVWVSFGSEGREMFNINVTCNILLDAIKEKSFKKLEVGFATELARSWNYSLC